MIGALRVLMRTYNRLLTFYRLRGEFNSQIIFPFLFSPFFFLVLGNFLAGSGDPE